MKKLNMKDINNKKIKGIVIKILLGIVAAIMVFLIVDICITEVYS